MMNNLFDPWGQGSRIKAIVGHYGSGKTEIALNMALDARAQGHESCIVDMDIVNPFFRSAEQHQLLRDRGVQLIHPPYALTGVDLPVLGAEVTRIFAAPALKTVLDVGGNDAGAAALGVYKQHFDQQSADMYYVVNLFRPFSETREQIIELLQRIERRARMKPAGLINNANLGDWTDIDQIIEGQRVLEDVSKALDLPIVAITGKQDVLKRLPQMDATLYPIERLLKPEWMEN